jgi:hypothetical protein
MLLKASISASESFSYRILEAGFCIYMMNLCEFPVLHILKRKLSFRPVQRRGMPPWQSPAWVHDAPVVHH